MVEQEIRGKEEDPTLSCLDGPVEMSEMGLSADIDGVEVDHGRSDALGSREVIGVRIEILSGLVLVEADRLDLLDGEAVSSCVGNQMAPHSARELMNDLGISEGQNGHEGA